jgi:hypothetical protein
MGENTHTTIRDALAGLRPALPVVSANLTILPLTTTRDTRASYVLLENALAAGSLSVTELQFEGTVPFLKAVNRGPRPVLIFAGEELLGAKQNRIVNATVLVGVGTTVLPVSCVEAGRWNMKTSAFSAGDHVSHVELRRTQAEHVRERSARVAGTGGLEQRAPQASRAEAYLSDQGAVWDEVAVRSRLAGTSSPTSAMADAYVARREDLDRVSSGVCRPASAAHAGRPAIPPVEGAVAAAVFVDGAFVCLDALFPARRFAQLYPKLVRGYALEAVAAGGCRNRPGIGQVDPEAYVLRLLATLVDAPQSELPAVDLGVDVRMESDIHAAAALLWQGEAIQLSAFPKSA